MVHSNRSNTMIVEFKWIEEIQMFILGRRGNRGTEPSPA